MTQQLPDPGRVWDELAARLPLPGSTTTSTARGLRKLAVRPEPARAARPDLAREVAAIAAELRAAVRGLVTGQLPWPLYLWGPAGTGKTSAALALLDHCGPVPPAGERSADVADWVAGFVEVRTIPRVRIGADQGRFDWSRDGQAGTFRWGDILGAVTRAPLVVFDEIGVGGEASDFRLDTALELIDRRAGNPVRPFVVTSNTPPSELPRVYDDRLSSRVLSGTVFRLAGDDRRFAAGRKAGGA